jgi:hypothetical protein
MSRSASRIGPYAACQVSSVITVSVEPSVYSMLICAQKRGFPP